MSGGQDQREAFERGIAAGRDPVLAAFDRGGVGVTNLRSPWLQRPCPRCGHTFRRGDRVERRDDGPVVHAADTAVCSADPATAPPSSSARNAFYLGLRRAWPPPPDLPVVRLDPGHPLLALPSRSFQRRACAICGHTLRPFDEVVICPCSPHDRLCEAAVHRDPTRLMSCWDDWHGSRVGGFCPITSRRLR